MASMPILKYFQTTRIGRDASPHPQGRLSSVFSKETILSANDHVCQHTHAKKSSEKRRGLCQKLSEEKKVEVEVRC